MANLTNITTGQITATSTAATELSVPTSADIAGVVVTSSAAVYLGNSTVTATKGLLIPANIPTLLPVFSADQLYAITPSSTATVSWMSV